MKVKVKAPSKVFKVEIIDLDARKNKDATKAAGKSKKKVSHHYHNHPYSPLMLKLQKKGNNSSDIDVGNDDGTDETDGGSKIPKVVKKSQSQYIIKIERVNACDTHDGKACIVLPGGKDHYQLTKADKSLWVMMMVCQYIFLF